MAGSALLALVVGSAVAGLVGALLGLGGGVLVVPLLTALGVDIRTAIPVSLLAVVATSSGAAASYLRSGLANVRIGILLCAATTTGAAAGALAGGVVPARALFLAFAGVLTASALLMLRTHAPGGLPPDVPVPDAWRLGSAFGDAASGTEVRYVPRRVGLGVALMAVAGAASGLLGIGSGAVKVPAMDLAMRLPIKASAATSNFMIGITGLAGAAVYAAQGRVAVAVAGPVVLGVLAGSSAGALLLGRLPGRAVRHGFVAVLLAVVVEMAWRGVHS